MRIEQLEYIVSVAKTQSFSKTAQDLHVSQPAISQSILRLEGELGISIFERSSSGVTPTTEGKVIIQNATDILSKLVELKHNANTFKTSQQKELKIGLVSGLHLPFLPGILSELKNEFPHQRVSFSEMSSVDILDSTINNKLDIGILAIYDKTFKHQNIVNFQNFYEIKFFIFVDRLSPLASLETLTPNDLKNYTFVMYNAEFMNWFFERFCNLFGPFDVLFTTNNIETIRETVRKGLAITIETEAELLNNPFVKTGEMIPIPLRINIPDKSHLGLVKVKNKSISIETNTFINALGAKFNEMFKVNV
ncbi:LysR family transcriptional regulator [Sporosarcina obsidiansis]|uniref:LysR family transcriptional regulator n=1 Tax=Sporosarcina obsidiansis TaxID=2660748 RepID=UPI00189111BD|nr:LysR family transcriptional regulator [Sporosarcina obsidiansis]